MTKSKHSQITIMVILALIIVVSIALVVVVVRKPTGGVMAIENPSAYIEQCAKQSLDVNVKYFLDNNGYPNKTNNYIVYLGEKVPYMCKSGTFYTPCTNQEPLLIEHFRSEIEKNVKKEVDSCFGNLTDAFESKGYVVEQTKNSTYAIRFQGDVVALDITKKVTLKKGDESKVYEKFYAQIISPLYKLVNTERHIVNFESAVCNFDYLTWEMYYRDIGIERFISGDHSKVYTLTHLDSNQTLRFAVKTCALPAGV
jgi:hypothetical protein